MNTSFASQKTRINTYSADSTSSAILKQSSARSSGSSDKAYCGSRARDKTNITTAFRDTHFHLYQNYSKISFILFTFSNNLDFLDKYYYSPWVTSEHHL